MANLLYVDNSNVWIEGMHVAAAKHGLAPDVWTAVQQKVCDYNWKIDFGKLFQFAGGDRSDVKKQLYLGHALQRMTHSGRQPNGTVLRSRSTTEMLLAMRRKSTPISLQR